MIELHLQRLAYDSKGTPGVLFVDGEFFCFTLELPWRDNQENISCIPEGTHNVAFRPSGKFPPERLTILEVDGRLHIRFHWGNDCTCILGCVLVGQSLRGTPSKERPYYIGHTKETVKALERRVRALPGFQESGCVTIHIYGPAEKGVYA